jgi:hypothetical protein
MLDIIGRASHGISQWRIVLLRIESNKGEEGEEGDRERRERREIGRGGRREREGYSSLNS